MVEPAHHQEAPQPPSCLWLAASHGLGEDFAAGCARSGNLDDHYSSLTQRYHPPAEMGGEGLLLAHNAISAQGVSGVHSAGKPWAGVCWNSLVLQGPSSPLPPGSIGWPGPFLKEPCQGMLQGPYPCHFLLGISITNPKLPLGPVPTCASLDLRSSLPQWS